MTLTWVHFFFSLYLSLHCIAVPFSSCTHSCSIHLAPTQSFLSQVSHAPLLPSAPGFSLHPPPNICTSISLISLPVQTITTSFLNLPRCLYHTTHFPYRIISYFISLSSSHRPPRQIYQRHFFIQLLYHKSHSHLPPLYK